MAKVFFKLKVGVSLYGGFAGNEKNINERPKVDRNGNGNIEPWEFQYETVLSGKSIDRDIWIYDEEYRIVSATGLEDNTERVLEYDAKGIQEKGITYLSGLEIRDGQTGVYINGLYSYSEGYSDDCIFVLKECEVYSNQRGIQGSAITDVYDCNIYHNSEDGLFYLRYVQNSYVHHNKDGVDTNGFDSGTFENCEIYCNGSNQLPGIGVSGVTARHCRIYKNIGDYCGGANGGTFYNCEIFDNIAPEQGGGLNYSVAYNCDIYNNKSLGHGGGAYEGTLINCRIYNNEALLDGGGTCNSEVYNSAIFNNKADGSGGGCGCAGGAYYSCDIYNNYASSYGGATQGEFSTFFYAYNCTIINNESASGSNNDGWLYNTIMADSFSGSASYSIFIDSYINGTGNFLATEKELKFVRPTSFRGLAANESQSNELQNADFSLNSGSVAIDIGEQTHNQTIAIEDRKGNPRPMGKKVDIGAHEYITYTTLPYENNFDGNSFSIVALGLWKFGNIPGQNGNYLYFDNEYGNAISLINNYVTTPFFEKVLSNKITLSFDFAGKYKTTNQQEKMHIVIAYLDSERRDTIATLANTNNIVNIHFSKEISQWVSGKVFRVLFAVEGPGGTVYSGITNLSITKQDGSVEISAKDAVVTYDGKPHAITYQINDERVDKSKVVVSYQKEGEEATSTPPVNAGVYAVTISVNDGELAGIKEVKLTIEKTYQNIVWEQTLGTLNALDRIQLKATSSSGLPVEFESDDETIAKVEKVGKEWWLVADTLDGEATIRAFQLGNENYNLANSLLKTVRVKAPEEVVTGIDGISNTDIKVYYVKSGNYIQIDNAAPGSMYYLYNSLGRLTASGDIQSSNWKVQTYREESGLYYLLIVNKDGKESFKVLINK